MKEKEEEKLKDLEFNNEEEDMEVLNEEQEIDKKEKKDKSNIIIIILMSIIIVLLIAILLIVLPPKEKKEKDNPKDNNTPSEKEKKKDETKEEDNTPTYDAVYINKYISNNRTITDLDGKKITDTQNETIYLSNDNELYLVRKTSGKIIVRKIENGEVFDVFNAKATGLIMSDNNKNLLGIYKTENKHDVLYLFSGTNYSETDLKDKYLYTYNENDGGNKYIYGNRYIVTAKDNSNKKKNNNEYVNFGIYDIKSNKQLIEGNYDGIEYLHDDKFVAIKGDKSGIINKDNTVLLAIKYKSISYVNNLYFVGNNNKLEVYDLSLKSLNSYVTVPKLSDFSYHICCGEQSPYTLSRFKDYALVGVLGNDGIYNYTLVNKNGDLKDIGKGYVSVVDNYLAKTSTEDTKLVLYDNMLNEQHVLETNQVGIQLKDENVSIFLNYMLAIDGKLFFNLNDDSNAGHITAFRKVTRGYEIKLEFNSKETGTLTISRDGAILRQVENVPVKAFLEAENNGITFSRANFIYSAGGAVYVEKLQS